MQTGTNQWQQHYKENVLVELICKKYKDYYKDSCSKELSCNHFGQNGMVSNTELSELVCPHRVLGRELSEFLSAYYLCDKANSPSFFAELTEFAPKLSEAQ